MLKVKHDVLFVVLLDHSCIRNSNPRCAKVEQTLARLGSNLAKNTTLERYTSVFGLKALYFLCSLN